MSNIDIKMHGDDTVVINELLDGVVTFTCKNLYSQGGVSNYTYKVSPDGKIIKLETDNSISEELTINKSKENAKEVLFNMMTRSGFEQIPNNLTEVELEDILEFSKTNIDKKNDYSKMFPFSVKVNNTGDLKVILLMYNGSSKSIPLTKFPFKLKDANDKVQIIDMIDINKTISPSKMVICEVQISKDQLSDKVPDLTSWTINFEMQ